MICPKCGFEQPDGPECMRCGIIISRYRGPLLGSAALRPPVDQPAPPMETAGTVYGGPQPAMAAAAEGTLYGGSPPGGVAPAFGTVTGSQARGTLDMGKVLGETFSIYFSNFLPFLLLTGVALSPLLVTIAMVADSAAGGSTGLMVVSLIVLVLSAVFCPQLATASITYGVFQQMRGRDASIGDCLGRGLSSLLPVLGLVIIQSLGVLAGLVACIIPGILLALRWAVSVPAAVEEQSGAFEALRRSTYLTDGFRGTIFGILFVVNALSSGLQRGLELALRDNASGLLIAFGAVSFLTVGITATATAVMYYRLRSIKESIDVDQIASVFA